jgi:hypothetical protein
MRFIYSGRFIQKVGKMSKKTSDFEKKPRLFAYRDDSVDEARFIEINVKG